MDARSSQSLHKTLEIIRDVVAKGNITRLNISPSYVVWLHDGQVIKAKQHKALCDYLDSDDQEAE